MRLPPARATIGIVAATTVLWALVAYAGLTQEAAVRAGFIPATWLGVQVPDAVPGWATPLTATLVHASLVHIAFNMLMLGFCGRYVEAALNWQGMLVVYLVGAYAAAAAQFLPDPHGMTPMIGASGAGSAVLGAYAILYGKRKPSNRHPKFAKALHTAQLAVAWIVLQLLVGFAGMGATEGNTVAIAAHIGGFLAGLLLAHPLLRFRYRNA